MTSKSFENFLEGAVPPQLLTPDLKNSLRKACAQIDSLALIDPQSNEIYLNEKNVRDALRNLASEDAVQRFLGRLGRDQKRLVSAPDIAHKKLQPIAMSELASKVPAFQPSPDFTYKSLGITERSSEAEIMNALKKRFPAISDTWVDAETLKQKISQALGSSAPGGITPQASIGDVVGCWGRHLPFWVVMAVISAFGVYFGLILLGGLGGLALAILFAFNFALGTINIILACITNPAA